MNARVHLAPPPRPGRLVLLGHPVAHSLSPTFQNAALVAARLDLAYDAVDVAPTDLPRAVEALRRVNAAGNVTVPHKAAFAGACDVLTDLARAAGAVNTFWCAGDGALVGDNTDVAGAVSQLEDMRRSTIASSSPRIALLGAGGAAAAVVLAAQHVWDDARVTVWSRRREAAGALAARFGGRIACAPSRAVALGTADVIVNATSLGLRFDDPLPADPAELVRGATVFDLVYAANETAWVRAARAAGHDARDGLGMLVEQGAVAFERWFGFEPTRARMWQAVAERTGRTASRSPVP